MNNAPDVSVIICTANRAPHLARTLESLRQACVPEGLSCELIVVDNASTDDTASVVRNSVLPGSVVRPIFEARPGKGFAYNTGLAAARGDALLFTDDDVRFPADWIAGMAQPILSGRMDAAVGGVTLALHLERPWMRPLHRKLLASTQYRTPNEPGTLTGANMAFGRHVLDRVPAFDTELGAGALGFMEESLFSVQLTQAGLRVGGALDVVVEHHFDPSRLLRTHFLTSAQKMGRSLAYFAHHWEHRSIKFAAMRGARKQAQLSLRRLSRPAPDPNAEGMPEWEIGMVQYVSFYRHYLKERKRARNYAEPFALVKQITCETN